jgi:diguanylate cyclase (GGDEF)-like protein
MKASTLSEPASPGPQPNSDLDNSILIVDDDPGVVEVLGRILSDVGQLRFATNGKDALRLARESIPDLILLDAEMPDISGFQLFESLRKESALSGVPVIFITSHSEASFEVSALEMGAVDFIAKPFSSSLVLARVRTQLRATHMAATLNRMAPTDRLTGLPNRRLFNEILEREWRRTRRGGDPMSLLLLDVDHFKLYNEHYGRACGDACLQRVAQSSPRPADLVARSAGDEFMLLLPQTPRDGAEHVARRILDAVQALDLIHDKAPTRPNITVSVGIGCYDALSACWANAGPDHRRGKDLHVPCTASDLVLAADQALRSGKRGRRARVTLCDISSIGTPESAPAAASRGGSSPS